MMLSAFHPAFAATDEIPDEFTETNAEEFELFEDPSDLFPADSFETETAEEEDDQTTEEEQTAENEEAAEADPVPEEETPVEEEPEITAYKFTEITLGYETVTYSGQPQKQSSKVIVMGTDAEGKQVRLKQGVDYKASYQNNTDAGTAAIRIRGIGKYDGEYERRTFTILPKPLSGLSFGKISNYTFKNKAIKPKVTIKMGEYTLRSGTDYTVKYSNNINAGTAKITITGIGNYSGKITKKFKILKAPVSKVTLKYKTMAYTGKSRTQTKETKVYATVNGENVRIKAGTDYTVSYKNNKKAGQATLTVTGKGNYTGTVSKNYRIAGTWCGKTICHALGLIDGKDYTNSKEAFKASYKKGFKNFEVDLQMTSDGQVVCRHQWEDYFKPSWKKRPTLKEFLQKKICGKYTPMTFKDVLKLMKKYPEIYLIIDGKYSTKTAVLKEYKQIMEDVVSTNSTALLKRMVIEIYSEDMKGWVDSVYPFKNYIFSLYKCWDKKPETLKAYCKWASKNGVAAIGMWHYLAKDEAVGIVKSYALNLYVHTVNKEENVLGFIDKRIGVYTDTTAV